MGTREAILFRSTLRNLYYTKAGNLISEHSPYYVLSMAICRVIGIKKVISEPLHESLA